MQIASRVSEALAAVAPKSLLNKNSIPEHPINKQAFHHLLYQDLRKSSDIPSDNLSSDKFATHWRLQALP